ncbi:hypothetical protein ZWY2020_025825 [Hordeum vulgare]|nr:hypothetical protein ZWY2020_025825 [Hordeum vulgare]
MATNGSPTLAPHSAFAHGSAVRLDAPSSAVAGSWHLVERRHAQAKRDLFADEDADAVSAGTLAEDDTSGSGARKKIADTGEQLKDGEEGAVKSDEVLHEAEVGKGLAGALKLLRDRGTLDEGDDKTSGKKKSKPAGIKKDGPKRFT